jgi:hypothetical protein
MKPNPNAMQKDRTQVEQGYFLARNIRKGVKNNNKS